VTFAHLNRRTHLYLGLALLPWFFMYALSSIPFAHTPFFDARDAAKKLPLWTLRMDRTVAIQVPAEQADATELRAFGAALLSHAGLNGTTFGVYRQNAKQINVYSYSFWKSTQLKYFIDDRRLTVEDRRFRWDHFLTGMHARGGFEQEGVLQTSWSVVVDVVQIAILLWIASGLVMWWGLLGHRGWGALTMVAGLATFVLFTLRL
jgi:hypothetical protein